MHQCNVEEELSVSAAWDLVRVASPTELDRLVTAYPERFLFNEERGALQLLDCGREVVAHLPLTEMQIALLSD